MKSKCKRRAHPIRPDTKMLQREAASVVKGRVQRLTPQGRWVEDDGTSPGKAFTAGVIAFYPGPDGCGCFGERRSSCLAEMAMRHVSAHYSYGSANGREVLRYVKA